MYFLMVSSNLLHPRKLTWNLKRMLSKFGISFFPGVPHFQVVPNVSFQGRFDEKKPPKKTYPPGN